MGSKSTNKNKEPLLPEEIETIKRTWEAVMENSKDFGCTIFLKFLKKYDYYSRFVKFGNVPKNELEHNKNFQNHSKSILMALNNVFTQLEDENKFKSSLIALGSNHEKNNVTEAEFYELREVILEFLVEKFKLNPKSVQAWQKAFDRVFVYVFEGLKKK